MFNYSSVYEWTTGRLFDYKTMDQEFGDFAKMKRNDNPRLNWRDAQAKAEQLMAQVAKENHFVVSSAAGFAYIAEVGAYSYSAISDRNITKGGWDGTGIWLDGDTGELRQMFLPDGEHSGNTVSNWLRALHFANWHGWLAYRILVCILGLVITLLSVTGVYIWLKKKRARHLSFRQRTDKGANAIAKV